MSKVAVLLSILSLLLALFPKQLLRSFCSHYLRISLFLIAVAGFLPGASAQTDTTQTDQDPGRLPTLFSVGLGVQYGFIFAHSQDVQNTKGANPIGAELMLSWQRNDADTWDLCNCFPRNGLLLNYYSYDNAILGRGASAAYFLEPTYKISEKTYFAFKGAAGLSYLNNPYKEASNPANQSYSTYINAYLLLGAGAWFRLNNQWWLNTSANYQHVSNGGMSKPNKGINWPTAGFAISYQPEQRPYYSYPRTTDKFWKNYAPRWDFSLFGIARRGYDEEGNRKRFPMAGIALQGAKQVGRINNITLGAEAYRDWELQNRLQHDGLEGSSVKAGVLVGHEFILGRFLFSQRLGMYVFDQTPYFDRLYHRWGLQYLLSSRIGVGFNLLAHREVAEFIDLRITYSFRRK